MMISTHRPVMSVNDYYIIHASPSEVHDHLSVVLFVSFPDFVINGYYDFMQESNGTSSFTTP